MSNRYEWGRKVDFEELKVRYWKHELNRARLLSDVDLERKSLDMLERFKELGYV